MCFAHIIHFMGEQFPKPTTIFRQGSPRATLSNTSTLHKQGAPNYVAIANRVSRTFSINQQHNRIFI